MSEEQTPQTPETPAPFDATSLDDTALTAEYDRIKARGVELAAKTEFSTDEANEFTELAERSKAVQAEFQARIERAEQQQAAREAFATMPELSIPAPSPITPTAVVKAAEVAPESTPAPTVPSVSEMAAQERPEVPETRIKRGVTRTFNLSSDAAGVMRRNTGDEIDQRVVGQAATELFKQFGKGAGAAQRSSRALATLSRDRGEEFRLPGDPMGDMAVIEHARSQNRFSGGSLLQEWSEAALKGGSGEQALTAAAGWCAPSENRYELCNLWSMDGMIDLPTTTAPRGGINYTDQPTWAQINDAAITSFTKLTEAQVIADTPKNCTELPCPTFTDRRLDVAVTCITGSFLQAHAYPEVPATWTDGLLTKHEAEINKDIIAQIVTKAGGATVIPAQGAAAPGFSPDTSATSSLLSAILIAREDMLYRSRMARSTVLEVVLPYWVLTQMRMDIFRRNAWHADPFALANATIVGWFQNMGVRPQFVYGWQDAQSGLATGPGDIAAPIVPITGLPTTVNFLIYPAGAVVLARQDVVTLTNVYDSTNLKQNLFTQLFTEEGYAPIFPCGEVRQYTANACPSGVTARQEYTSCAAPAA